jgi:hypothetical protein
MNTTNAFLELFSDQAATPRAEFIAALQKQFVAKAALPARSGKLTTKHKLIVVATIIVIVAAILALVFLPRRDMSDPAQSSVIETVVTQSQENLDSFAKDTPAETTAPTTQPTQTQQSGPTAHQQTTPPAQQPAAPIVVQGFMAEYWNTSAESVGPPAMPGGSPVFTTVTNMIAYNWGAGSPAGAVQTDGFVARYTKSAALPQGAYKVVYASDNGLRMFVNETAVFDKWNLPSASGTAYFTTDPAVPVTEIIIEYYEADGNASISVEITKVP